MNKFDDSQREWTRIVWRIVERQKWNLDTSTWFSFNAQLASLTARKPLKPINKCHHMLNGSRRQKKPQSLLPRGSSLFCCTSWGAYRQPKSTSWFSLFWSQTSNWPTRKPKHEISFFYNSWNQFCGACGPQPHIGRFGSCSDAEWHRCTRSWCVLPVHKSRSLHNGLGSKIVMHVHHYTDTVHKFSITAPPIQ